MTMSVSINIGCRQVTFNFVESRQTALLFGSNGKLSAASYRDDEEIQAGGTAEFTLICRRYPIRQRAVGSQYLLNIPAGNATPMLGVVWPLRGHWVAVIGRA